MFLSFAGMLLGLVLFFLLFPVWNRRQTHFITGNDASLDADQTTLHIEKQSLLASLSDLELDYAQEKFSAIDYGRLKRSYEQRLVKILNDLESIEKAAAARLKEPAPPSGSLFRWNGTLSLLLGIAVLSGTAGVYSMVYGKIDRSRQVSVEEGGGGPAMPPVNPAEMVARLEKRLKENPNDLEGQMMAGRSYMTMERWEDARKAWSKVLELDEANEIAQFNLADVILRTAPPGNKTAYEEALIHLEAALIKVPREPVVLWEKGLALVHLGRTQEADQAWTAAFQNLPAGSKDADFVKQALQNLRSGKTPSP
ncbi:MAG: tetratricopeptide repeat protein [Nitrospirae bacterium]|nr:tetratricopeptide repeat protein [Nitrospirota bacterium]MBI3604518.1 tetratricopeptide repeat protein [Nitrospirota bacterium]